MWLPSRFVLFGINVVSYMCKIKVRRLLSLSCDLSEEMRDKSVCVCACVLLLVLYGCSICVSMYVVCTHQSHS